MRRSIRHNESGRTSPFRAALLDALIFNLVAAIADAHGKNLSIRCDDPCTRGLSS
jgi:hypothetical protein